MPLSLCAISLIFALACCDHGRAADLPSHAEHKRSAPTSVSFAAPSVVWTDDIQPELRAEVARAVHTLFSGATGGSRLRRGVESLLELLADAGYRGAALQPRDFALNDGNLSWQLVISPGQPVRVTRWELVGLSRTDTAWLKSVLNLPRDAVAGRGLYDLVRERVRGVSYLSLVSDPEVVVQPGDTTAVVRVRLSEKPPATFAGALAAGGSGPTGSSVGLAGRASLGLAGWFGRDRSLDLHYEHPRSDEMLLRFRLGEANALDGRLDWQVAAEDWARSDHRQTLGLNTAYAPVRGGNTRSEVDMAWTKITAGRSPSPPARLLELKLGVAHGRPDLPLAFSPPPGLSWSIHAAGSQRRQWNVDPGGDRGAVVRRVRLEGRFSAAYRLAEGWRGMLVGEGRWWPAGVRSLGTGDEWFLGGADRLRGYDDRSLAASTGVCGSVELSRLTSRGIGVAFFTDAAWLRPFAGMRLVPANPYSYGLAILMASPGRQGRLEVAWRDHAAWRDGIVRLTVSQGWR